MYVHIVIYILYIFDVIEGKIENISSSTYDNGED